MTVSRKDDGSALLVEMEMVYWSAQWCRLRVVGEQKEEKHGIAN
ncbi:hypothetical protein KSD_74490 [Ktedonobacter sp. SOSP1-85]|nr:hypothetical protein [Ktedonobacter sp. SOSP1-85]GHO79678.1 hypothetical protein KSD_74490 [Ktedonobacter sp. SOSP1-85]